MSRVCRGVSSHALQNVSRLIDCWFPWRCAKVLDSCGRLELLPSDGIVASAVTETSAWRPVPSHSTQDTFRDIQTIRENTRNIFKCVIHVCDWLSLRSSSLSSPQADATAERHVNNCIMAICKRADDIILRREETFWSHFRWGKICQCCLQRPRPLCLVLQSRWLLVR